MRRILVLLCLCAGPLAGAPAVVDDHIKIDQFGYRPAASKVAVISDPRTGYNAPDPFTPASTLEVRRWNDDSVAFSGPIFSWNGGAEHGQSGDVVWWFDFTALQETGPFYIYDPLNAVGSGRFEIDEEIYREILKAALLTFYYQRCGVEKDAAFAGADWADTACHISAEQDADCRWVLDTTPATSRDLAGGWHDAGDYNKYINFADGPVHDLLFAYEVAPRVWTDEVGIPESGNGVPDILDEIKWELDWFLKMQQSDGSLLHKIAVTDFSGVSPPSSDPGPRRYAEATASATISGAATFAHAAIVFGGSADPGMQAYAGVLEAAAVDAWSWLETNPGLIPSAYDNAGFVNSSSEEDAYSQETNRLCAASYLYALTGDNSFRVWFDDNYDQAHLLQWGYAYPFESEYQDCLLYYAAGANPIPAVRDDIQAAFSGSIYNDHLVWSIVEEDAWRAWLDDVDYTWGSNRTKAHEAILYLNMLYWALDLVNHDGYRAAAEEFVHYLHGVNPLGFAYLSNMASYGAENSIQEFYHSWFADGTDWDNASTSLYGPAPGFVPGGPNPHFAPDASYPGTIEPPQNQPIQKSYLDWNTNWPENSWEITENSITYQAAYIRLLSWFVPQTVPPPSFTLHPHPALVCEGDSAQFTAAAVGVEPFTWLWFLEGVPLSDGPDISGATADTLDLTNVQPADAGVITIEVTDADFRSTTSDPADLTVDALPQSPGDSLRVERRDLDPLLTWSAATGAAWYDILRCDASIGPCGPALHDDTFDLFYLDSAPGRLFWYGLESANLCGATP